MSEGRLSRLSGGKGEKRAARQAHVVVCIEAGEELVLPVLGKRSFSLHDRPTRGYRAVVSSCHLLDVSPPDESRVPAKATPRE